MESFEKHLKKLSSIIDSQYRSYKSVFELVNEERSILVAADLDALTLNLRKQQTLMHRISLLEKDRLQELEVLAIYLGTTPEKLKLSYIIKNSPDDYSEKLSNQERTFKSLLEEITKLNKSNKFLINNSLQYLDKHIQIFFGSVKEKGVYSKPTTAMKINKSSTMMLDRKA